MLIVMIDLYERFACMNTNLSLLQKTKAEVDDSSFRRDIHSLSPGVRTDIHVRLI